jgi:hypothetical protein
MLPPVQSILENCGIEAINGRVFQTVAPEKVTKDASGGQLDYVVWTMISQIPNNTLADMPEDDAQRVQVDYYGSDASRARNGMTIIRDAFELVGYVLDGPTAGYESDTRLHRQSMDVAFITQRDYETTD